MLCIKCIAWVIWVSGFNFKVTSRVRVNQESHQDRCKWYLCERGCMRCGRVRARMRGKGENIKVGKKRKIRWERGWMGAGEAGKGQRVWQQILNDMKEVGGSNYILQRT